MFTAANALHMAYAKTWSVVERWSGVVFWDDFACLNMIPLDHWTGSQKGHLLTLKDSGYNFTPKTFQKTISWFHPTAKNSTCAFNFYLFLVHSIQTGRQLALKDFEYNPPSNPPPPPPKKKKKKKNHSRKPLNGSTPFHV